MKKKSSKFLEEICGMKSFYFMQGLRWGSVGFSLAVHSLQTTSLTLGGRVLPSF